MRVTPSLRGGIPSLYTQRALGATRGLRGVAVEVPGLEMPNVDQDETSFGLCTLCEVNVLLVSLMALVQRIPSSRTSETIENFAKRNYETNTKMNKAGGQKSYS